MTRVILIHAGPTPWDIEGRLVGDHTLPLTDDARGAIEKIVAALPDDIAAVYCSRSNEACDQAAKIIAARFKLRPRDAPDLHGLNLGLWQGLQREQLRFRFPNAFPRWEQAPAEIIPPGGEPLSAAHQRLVPALRKILHRDKGMTIALAMRPMSQQIAAGILRGESLDQIAAHLHKVAQMEAIEVTDDAGSARKK